MTRWRPAGAVLLLCTARCAGVAPMEGDAGAPDSGRSVDAGFHSAQTDAGSTDAGTDAAVFTDAGTVSQADAGPSATDSGPAPLDAGVITFDAGPPAPVKLISGDATLVYVTPDDDLIYSTATGCYAVSFNGGPATFIDAFCPVTWAGRLGWSGRDGTELRVWTKAHGLHTVAGRFWNVYPDKNAQWVMLLGADAQGYGIFFGTDASLNSPVVLATHVLPPNPLQVPQFLYAEATGDRFLALYSINDVHTLSSWAPGTWSQTVLATNTQVGRPFVGAFETSSTYAYWELGPDFPYGNERVALVGGTPPEAFETFATGFQNTGDTTRYSIFSPDAGRTDQFAPLICRQVVGTTAPVTVVEGVSYGGCSLSAGGRYLVFGEFPSRKQHYRDLQNPGGADLVLDEKQTMIADAYLYDRTFTTVWSLPAGQTRTVPAQMIRSPISTGHGAKVLLVDTRLRAGQAPMSALKVVDLEDAALTVTPLVEFTGPTRLSSDRKRIAVTVTAEHPTLAPGVYAFTL